ncbi:MAG: LLM class flavin-dependent oxidoreductase [Gaiellaceae bacterium]
MSRRLKIGVMLHAGVDGRAADTPEQAGPYPESVVVLAAAAGVTERIQLGFGVMILALRHPAWTAKRFAAYAEAGATWLVLSTTGDDWHSQWELIAEAATLLPRVHE